MTTRRGFTLIELLVVIAIIAILAAVLFPIYAKAQRIARATNCQSNMKHIGAAVKLYLSDWQGTFPTNRPFTSADKKLGDIAACVPLSPPTINSATVEPRKFDYGITWVEALYSYVDKVTEDSNSKSVWECGASSMATDPNDADYHCATHYVFNGCLIEQPEGIAKSQSNLMMVREFGRLTASTLRPTNPKATGDRYNPPQFAFMNNTDAGPNMTNTPRICRIHSEGSHILFADGHVKGFDLAYFPEFNSQFNAGHNWDPVTQQWYNFNGNNLYSPVLRRSIAITP